MDKSTKHLPRESLGDSYNSVIGTKVMTENTKMLKTKKIQIFVFVKKSQKKKEMEKFGEQLSQILID